jgi:stalled ribosome alternative rescue factor ArfA
LLVLGNVPVIEIGDPKIKQNVEEKGEIKNNKIKAVISYTNNILDISVNTKYKDRFDKKVKGK